MGSIEIYTDGACSGNPGPGGWGAIMVYKDHEKTISGGEPDTTNNRMEMLAAIVALESLKRPCDVCITTDSTYLIKGATEWMVGWKKRNWKKADKKPVLNIDLWQRLDVLIQKHNVQWFWVRGHSGHEMNERVDEVARLAIEDVRPSL